MARRLKTSSDVPVPVSGKARHAKDLRPLSALGVGCPAAGQNLETGRLSRRYLAEISLNVTLNHNQPTKVLPQEIIVLEDLRYKYWNYDKRHPLDKTGICPWYDEYKWEGAKLYSSVVKSVFNIMIQSRNIIGSVYKPKKNWRLEVRN